MATEQTSFVLDDGQSDAAGFNESSAAAAEAAAEQTLTEKTGEKADGLQNGKTDDGKAEGQRDAEGQHAEREGQGREEVKKTDPEWRKDFDSMRQENRQLRDMLAQIQNQIKPAAPASEKPKDPELPPLPTREMWDTEPERAAAMVDARNQAIAETKVKAMREEMANETKQVETSRMLRESHNAAWKAVTDAAPEFNDPNSEEGRLVQAIFFNKDHGKLLQDHPQGPFLAAAAAYFLKAINSKQAAPAQSAAVTPEAKQIIDKALEKQRQDRLKNQVMHTGGKGGNQSQIQLTPEQKAFCKARNYSEESYKKGLAAMKRG